MIKAEHKEKLKKLGIDVDAIIAAHNDTAEKDITVPDGTILTDEQLTARDDVKVKEGEKAGEKKAIEIAKTELKKHAGLDISADRWGDVGKEIKAAINATGDTKLTALQEQNAALLADKTALETAKAQAETALKQGMFEVNILGKLPANSLGLSPKETFELAKIRGYQAEQTETGVVWKKNGEVMKDPTTHAPLTEDKAIAAIWTAEKWTPTVTPPSGGRGGAQKPSGGNSAAGLMSKSAVEAEWEANNPGKGIATPEGMSFYAEYAKQPGFDMFN
ncbi:MAG: hypothetical protein K0Q79_2751 [Flavipsychrobacter sp.]|jgi:hypothetical protein|nr:hypothetical protein [Flavipsychrobacter sp.]